MIAKAIDKLISISGPHIVSTESGDYSDVSLRRVPAENKADPIEVTTLSAFVSYIKDVAENADKARLEDYFVQVESPTCVKLMSRLNRDRERECLIRAQPILPKIPFEAFVDTERMIIILQAAFQPDPGTDLQTILNFVGTVTAGTIKDYSDDGVSQQATVRSGPRGKENKIVPSPCTLRPIRTFTEVIQPASAFIFRMKEGSGDTVQAALFEADGGAWRIDAIDRLAEHLEKELKDTGVKIIG